MKKWQFNRTLPAKASLLLAGLVLLFNSACADDLVPPGYTGNPIIPGKGVCDPAIRIYNDRAYLHATHDTPMDAPERLNSKPGFHMMDWWVWSSPDLVEWKLESKLDPKIFGFKEGFRSCFATDGNTKNGKYYFFVCTPAKTYVAVADSPAGPWSSPLGNKPIMDGRDPTSFIDDDGTPYLITVNAQGYHLARLTDDMISLAEEPRAVEVINPEGPGGKGHLDDKPYIHKRKGWYYLSWGCFYGMSKNVYGPYECKGSVLSKENIEPPMSQKAPVGDRHGSFFEWRGQWFYVFNDRTLTGTGLFRDSAIVYIEYLENGEMAPARLTKQGVKLPKSGEKRN